MGRTRNTEKSSLERNRIWKVCFYIRLSREDGNIESLSVANQKKILEAHLKLFKDQYTFVGVYIDDGISGTSTSARVKYLEMLSGIEQEKIDCVMVKDLSRAFRNISDQSSFIDEYVQTQKIRFISLSSPTMDSYLNPQDVDSIMVDIQGAFNAYHPKETSRKVRDHFDAMRKDGLFIGAFAPYGYIKDPNNKNRLLIDENAAEVVRSIFHMFVNEGMSMRAIAFKLNEQGVPAPAKYKREVQKLRYHSARIVNHNYNLWVDSAIRSMLKNEDYIGNLVQGKQRNKSYKDHTKIAIPESEYIIKENTHEAIIDNTLFQRAKELLTRDTRTANNSKTVHLFSGLLRCPDCGASMHRHASKNITYYKCRTYREKSKEACTPHTIREDTLEQCVFKALRSQIQLIGRLMEKVNNINQLPTINTKSDRLQKMLDGRKQELQRAISLSDGLYEDYKTNLISRDEYARLKAKYQTDVERLKDAIQGLEEEQNILNMRISTEHPLFVQFKQHNNIQQLDRSIVITWIDVIYVHEDSKLNIKLKCSDQLQLIVDYIKANQEALVS